MISIKEFLSAYRPLGVELLPYHKMGEHKYGALNMKQEKFDVLADNTLSRLRNVFD